MNRLIEKPNKKNRFIYNWRPISLLNVNQKLISKILAARLENVLPFLIGPGQLTFSKAFDFLNNNFF